MCNIKFFTLLFTFLVKMALIICNAQINNNIEFKLSGYYIIEYYGISNVENKNGIFYFPTDEKRRVIFHPCRRNRKKSVSELLSEVSSMNKKIKYVDYNDFDVLDPGQGQEKYLNDTSWQSVEKILEKTPVIQYGGNEYQILFVESFWVRLKLAYTMRGIIPVYFDASVKESDYESVELYFPTKLVKVKKAKVN